MEPLERLIAEVIGQHPEYHPLLEAPEPSLTQDFPADSAGNPFLHMSLHIALREQLSIDRPQGIVDAFSRLVWLRGDAHAAEHEAMECLARSLWEARERGEIPNERGYLKAVRSLTRKKR